MTIIGICYDLNFESNYVPFISFKSQEKKDAAENYIIREVNYFFENILNIDISVEQIAYHKIITENDFKKVDIKYFYDNLFYDLGERNSEGKLEHRIKWGITFDEKCAPIKVVMANSNDGNQNKITQNRRYGTIDINGTPIFYYIYFTLQEILDVIKQIPTS